MTLALGPSQRVWLYCGFACLAASLFGGDTGSIGSITQMPQFEQHFGHLSEAIRGLVVAVILIPSAVTGLLAGSVSDRISRKKTISLGAAIFSVGMIISAVAPSLAVLIAARAFAGIGEGFFLSAGAIYITEMSPKHQRGRMLTMFQCFLTLALASAFFVCYATIRIQSSWAWRTPFVMSGTIAALLSFGTFFLLPYSPRWLISKGRREDAEQVLAKITPDNAAGHAERQELLSQKVTNEKAAWGDMFKKGYRGRTLLATHLNIFQQLSGIDFVLFYAPLLFAQAGLPAQTASFVASGVTGLIIFAFTLLGNSYIDKVGRRPLVLWGGTGIATCLILIGALYASGAAYTTGGKWAVIVLIELYACVFSGTWALVVRLYAAEIQPPRTRSAASSFGTGSNQLINCVVALTGPAFLAKSSFGPYLLYGGLTVFGTAVAWVFMPETIGKSLESIDSTFEGSPIAVTWPRLLRKEDSTAQRRPSRRGEENGRPSRFEMQRLGSSANTLQESAIDE